MFKPPTPGWKSADGWDRFQGINDMAQEQRIVPLVLFRREPEQAVATGNSAAWVCVCRRVKPLIGRSGSAKGVTEKTAVCCPDCGRRYFVVPEDDRRTAVREVQEV